MKKSFHFGISAFLLAQGYLGGSQRPITMRNPPASVLSEAWMILAELGPISTDAFTTITIDWRDGAYYMHVVGGRYRRWKLILIPPLRDAGWRVRLLSPNERQIRSIQRRHKKDPQVSWSRSFARAMPHLPAIVTEAESFKIRAIPEEGKVVFYFETGPPPAWITFTADPSGVVVVLDRGF